MRYVTTGLLLSGLGLSALGLILFESDLHPHVAPALHSQSTPFGLRMGASKEQIERVVTLEETETKGEYLARNVPNGSNVFQYYVLTITPTYGLCVIGAAGLDIQTHSYETAISEHQKMVQHVADQYGEPSKSYDRLDRSAWDEPNDWVTALAARELVLATVWLNMEGAVKAIIVQATASSANKAFITVQFESQQTTECLEELEEMNNPL